MSKNRYCIIIPTYNNCRTVADVAQCALTVCGDVIVVNDGSTDGTADVLKDVDVTVLTHDRNRGKGKALKTGLMYARGKGFTHAVTIDADGQHYPEDIPVLIEASEQNAGSLIVGCRNLTSENMPRQNTFANRFSNFWFRLQTAQHLDDTQSGFRIYPLDRLYGMWLITSRYEAELELMVYAAWHGVRMIGVPVRVLYQPEGERVSHFRPFRDFFRITVLNTLLCLGAVLYALPAALFRLITGKRHG
ncbi:MAG: glycosyltransferase family 2 protein [Bacteroidaceae bacterium]|nr:glycosyltransferase family 2 protein [Bacteroidaceae bacterium]